ncbi:PIN domain-containing protein [Streptomyces sp. NPDC048665]|uniref:PIN domain-containing protein n=1 Tax=Streptomyces sp. NPDC048665 TaxID=3155490 RepID=UPI003428E622
MRLKPGVTIEQAERDLCQALELFYNCRGGHELHQYWLKYLHAVDLANPHLRQAFIEPDLAEGLYTRRYWHLLANGDDTRQHLAVIREEVELQLRAMEKAKEQLESLKSFASRPGEILVFDTNMLLHWEPMTVVPWPQQVKADEVRLIVPMVVIEELDRKKYADSSTAKAAVKAIRMIERLLRDTAPGSAVPVRDGTTLEVLLDEADHRRRPLSEADTEIIERAALLDQITGSRSKLLTGDLHMKLMARTLGLSVFELDAKFKNQQQKKTLKDVQAEEAAASAGTPAK